MQYWIKTQQLKLLQSPFIQSTPDTTVTFKVLSLLNQDYFISQSGLLQIRASLPLKLSLMTPTEDSMRAIFCCRDIIRRGLGTAVKEA